MTRDQRGESLRHGGPRLRVGAHQPGGGEVGAQVGQQQAHGAEDPGIGRHQHAADLELARQPGSISNRYV